MSNFYEEFVVGEENVLGSRFFTREAVVEFARAFDPQPFHLDDKAGEASIFGSLCASGWHTASVAMRCIVDWREKDRAERVSRGEASPPLGVSPGLRELRWGAPVRPGDTVTYSSRVISKRETKRPQWGLVSLATRGVNQHGVEVISFLSSAFAARKGA